MSETIILCRACGHSYGFGCRLSVGSDDCGSIIEEVDEKEWCRVAPRLKLTKAGRNTLAGLKIKP